MTALACACANREEEFIIFEDDIKLPDDFGKKWSEFRKKVPDWVDVIHLDHAHHDAAVHSKINDALERSFYPFGSGAIWWRGWKVADKALHLLRPVNGPYDCLLIRYVFPFMGHACAVPKICDQRSGNGEWSSTIGSSCWMSEYENAKGIPLK
jgi:GR25 family glycosyltransferase involved in LPS biosynthesis